MEINLKNGYWGAFEKEFKNEQKRSGINFLHKVKDYSGQKILILSCTQLDCSQSEQNKIVNEWCELFRTNQLPVEKIWFTSRISQKILDSICYQTNLKGLWIKWGVYDNIYSIANLKSLEYLHLGGGASLKNIDSVFELKNLKAFEAVRLFNIHDYSLLKNLEKLVDISIEGDPYSSFKKVSIKSLDFLNEMPQLIRLNLCMTKIEDQSYRPISNLPNLKFLELPRDKDLDKDIHLFKKFNTQY